MGKKSRTKQPKNAERAAVESRTAEVTTIFWMLSTLTAAACECIWIMARGIAAWQFAGEPPRTYSMFLGVLLFATIVVGVVTLVLMFVVLRRRRVPPPWPVVVFSTIAGLLPFALAFVP